MEFEEVIRLRRSTRAFASQEVSRDELERIVDAAQLAPIAGADYSMSHITVVTDAALLDEIRTRCAFRRKDGTMLDPLYGATALIVLSATGPSDDNIEFCNVACAIENMSLAATDLGLGSVYLWGYIKKLATMPDLVAKLGLPEGYTVLSSLGVGHALEPAAPREPKEKIAVDWI